MSRAEGLHRGLIAAQLALIAVGGTYQWNPALLGEAGSQIRTFVGSLAGWDQHRTNHDTIYTWAPLLAAATCLTPAIWVLLFPLKNASVQARRLLLLSCAFVSPWYLVLSTLQWDWHVAIPHCGITAVLWFWHVRLPASVPWWYLASSSFWFYFAAAVDPWPQPVTAVAVLLAGISVGTDLAAKTQTLAPRPVG